LTASPRSKNVPHTGSVRNGRWEFLDALRGVAALLVVVQHSAEHGSWFASFSSRYLNFGEIGVVTFFLVSGYIIPVSIERYGSAIRFWIGRAFRLLPAYWLSFAIVVVIKLVFADKESLSNLAKPVRYLLANLTLTPGLLKVPYGLGIYWTLSYEAIFYVLCTVLFLLGLLKHSRLWAIAAASALLLGNVSFALFLHRAMSAEKLGVLVTAFMGTLIFRYSVDAATRSDVFAALAVMTVTVIVGNWLRLGVFSNVGARVPNGPLSGDLSFLSGYLLFGLLYVLRDRQFPPVLVWLGKISYSVYLFHAIVLWCLPADMAVWLQVLLTLSITLAISSFTYKFVEQSALSVQRRLFPHKSPTQVAVS
jgi:peptidoglycan/LPS O-acetylase OafA/YrhL